MTSLKITPNFEKKTAKFEGTIAGGERVRVEISDANKYIGGLDSLRLRAVGSQGETLAQFPFENSEDAWVQGDGKIICELNLNTDKLLEAVPPASRVMVLFVLDDGENEVLYFKSFCAVDHWPRKVGEEEPVDLGGYADFVKDATESIASAEVAIEKASENAMNASKNAEEAAKNAKEAVATVKKIESSLSTKADKTALDTEISRATHSEAQIDSKVDTIIADDAGKSARTIAAEEVAKVVADAPADFDTLKEIAEYIESDKTGAAQMVTKIDANANAITAEVTRATKAEAALDKTITEKVGAVENGMMMVATMAESAQQAADTAQQAADTAQQAADTALTDAQMANSGVSDLSARCDDIDMVARNAEEHASMANTTASVAMETANAAYSPTNPPPAPDLSGYATKSEIPYSLIEVPLADRINLTDRAVNKVTADGSLNHIQFVFPEKKEGKSRDFFLRLVITGETVPTLSFDEPNGGSVSFDVDDDSWANIEQGVNILMFTDTEA